MIRPFFLSACVTISTPTAIRSFSRWTAAIILRSSLSMPSTISDGESLSIPSVAGLICSVGRDCHFERDGIAIADLKTNREYYHTDVADEIDAYLDHLRVERRLATHTLESYARDLRSLAEFAAGESVELRALDRAALETFVRQQMSRGLSPRTVARLVAAVRGFFRFLVLDRRLDGNPADDLHPPHAWPALP